MRKRVKVSEIIVFSPLLTTKHQEVRFRENRETTSISTFSVENQVQSLSLFSESQETRKREWMNDQEELRIKERDNTCIKHVLCPRVFSFSLFRTKNIKCIFMTKRRRTDRTFFFPPEISSWTQFLFSLFSYVSCLNIKWKWCHRLECLRNKSIRGQEDLQMYVAFDPENVNIERLPLFLVISPSLIVSGKALVTQTGNGKSWCLWIKRILYGKLLYFWLTCGFMIVWRTCHCLVNVFSTASVSPPLLFSLSLLAKQHDSRHNSIDIWEVQCVTHVTQKDIHKWHSVNALLVQHTLYDTIELLLGCPFLFFYSLSLQQHNSWQ